MTTSELQMWVSSRPLGTEHFYNIGLAEGKWKGFLHAIEIAQDFLKHQPGSYATVHNSLAHEMLDRLKAYAGEK